MAEWKPGAKHRRRAAGMRPFRAGAAPAALGGGMKARTAALVCVVATGAAVLERVWFGHAWGEAASLTSAFYHGDASRFVDYATAIVQGRTFDNGIPFHPPGWPLALAAFLRAAGALRAGDAAVPVAAVKLLVATLSGTTVGLATWLAYEMAGPGAMLAVALLGPFHFGHIVEGTVANSEALYGLCLTITLFAAWRWQRTGATHPFLWALAAGAAGGLAMLVRAEFLACGIALLALAAWWKRPGWILQSGAFLVAFAAVLIPSTLWHWRTLSAFNAGHVGRVAGPLPTFAPVTSYGPFNFAMANHENADGGPNRDHPLLERCNAETTARLEVGQLDLECPAVYDLYVHGYSIGARWLIAHPVAALDLVTRKLAFTVGFLAHGYLVDDIGPDVDGTRRRVDLVDPERGWLIPVHLALIAAGVFVLRKHAAALGIVLAGLAGLVGSTVLFYGYVRLGVAYLPAFWVLQGAGASAAISRVAGSRRRGYAVVVAAVVTLVVTLTLWDGAHTRSSRALVLDGARTASGALIQDETLEVRRVH
jgi:hypothetical protein